MNQEEMDLLKRGSIIISSKDEMERRELFHSAVQRFINRFICYFSLKFMK